MATPVGTYAQHVALGIPTPVLVQGVVHPALVHDGEDLTDAQRHKPRHGGR